MAALALVDGEHYPDVVRDALSYVERDLGYDISAIVFLGGTEKLDALGALSYGDIPVYTGEDPLDALKAALEKHRVDCVLDLSDEPIVGYRERFRLISESLHRGVEYRGSDFAFIPPSMAKVLYKPAIGVWGSGKRVGKTAVSGFAVRHFLKSGIKPCVLTMGRGGPPEPELLDRPDLVDDSFLVGIAREGKHAASDHFENAMMGNAVAIGCRRCGGGMGGEPFFSNVLDGAALIRNIDCDLVLCEGSGAAIPPVEVDAVLLAVSAIQPVEYVLEFLGTFRLLRSDLVLVTMCEEIFVSSDKLHELISGIRSINPCAGVLKIVFRPRPLGDVKGRRVFLTSTAPVQAVEIQAKHLEEKCGARIVGYSPNLADRRRLREDLEKAEKAEVLLTELKAAGVDTVSLKAKELGIEVVYVDNEPVPLEGDLGLEIDRLKAIAFERFQRKKPPQ